MFYAIHKNNLWGKEVLKQNVLDPEVIRRDVIKKWKEERKKGAVCLDRRATWIGYGDPLLRVIGLSRREMFYLWQWKLGVCGGSWRRCKVCNNPLSREHFLICGEGDKVIKEIVRKLGNRRVRWKSVSQRLNWILDSDQLQMHPKKLVMYKKLAAMIEVCKIMCLGWEVNERQYSDDEDPKEKLNSKLKTLREKWEKKRVKLRK